MATGDVIGAVQISFVERAGHTIPIFYTDYMVGKKPRRIEWDMWMLHSVETFIKDHGGHIEYKTYRTEEEPSTESAED